MISLPPFSIVARKINKNFKSSKKLLKFRKKLTMN